MRTSTPGTVIVETRGGGLVSDNRGGGLVSSAHLGGGWRQHAGRNITGGR